MQGFEGKTVKDLELYMEKRNKYHKLIWICMIVILAMGLLSGYLAKEIIELQAANNDLRQQINTIKERNQSLMQEIGEFSMEYMQYKIKPKDSFAKISLRFYGTEVYGAGLAHLNGLNSDVVLQIGQTLIIPKTPLETWENY